MAPDGRASVSLETPPRATVSPPSRRAGTAGGGTGIATVGGSIRPTSGCALVGDAPPTT